MATKDSQEWLKARVEKAKEALALQSVSQEALRALRVPQLVAGEKQPPLLID